ncbi:type II secretion system protein GspM [Geopsychrobacter electrodiphilus]|uniref:type II secretion system protein GspM n=1 Tax=Geopsychrobacter electrodiphilus TaxID=225196 RepID=UPI0003655B88|nr:type II secretion system protein GspM [Geopsychrobacter electrodiphilus]
MVTRHAQIQLYLNRFNSRSLRERLLLLLVILVVLLVLFDLFVVTPGLEQRKQVQAEINKLKTDIVVLQAEQTAAKTTATVDPDQLVRQQMAQLQVAIGTLDQQLKNRLIDLLSPREMPAMLQQILGQQKGLRLISMQNYPAEPVLPQVDKKASSVGLYRHALHLDLEGGYLDLLSYLKALEGMPHKVYWDILSIEKDKLPMMHIQLQLHTLSLTENWIGV